MSFWWLIFGIAVGIIVLMVLVVIHELGHFFAARKAGVKVEEFGIGFPPKLWSCEWGASGSGQWFKRKDVDENGVLKSGGWIFSINIFPIGGFCRMQGDEADAATPSKSGSAALANATSKNRDYSSASFGGKTLILFGGIIANFLAAIIIFTILAWFGMPKVFDNQFTVPADTRETFGDVLVATVVEGSPAEQIGIQTGFILNSIAGQEITRSSQVATLTREHAGQEVEVSFTVPKGFLYEGNCFCPEADLLCECPNEAFEDDYRTVTVTLSDGSEGRGFLGVATFQNETLRSTWSAPIVGVGTTVQFTYETVKGLGGMIGGLFSGIFKQFSGNEATREEGQAEIKSTGDGLAGPIAIVGVLLPEATRSGFLYVLFVAGVISVSLAIMNLLPIPALDGGRWLLTAIFKWLKKPLTVEIESKINAIGFFFLIGLMILVTILDIGRLGG